MSEEAPKFLPSKAFESRTAILLKEWDYCQTNIGRYDTIATSIRGWVITILAALITTTATKGGIGLLFIGAGTVVLFWVVEAINRVFLNRFLRRSKKIERYLRAEFQEDQRTSLFRSDFSFPQMVNLQSGLGGRKNVEAVFFAAMERSVGVVYVLMLVACFVSGGILSPRCSAWNIAYWLLAGVCSVSLVPIVFCRRRQDTEQPSPAMVEQIARAIAVADGARFEDDPARFKKLALAALKPSA